MCDESTKSPVTTIMSGLSFSMAFISLSPSLRLCKSDTCAILKLLNSSGILLFFIVISEVFIARLVQIIHVKNNIKISITAIIILRFLFTDFIGSAS